MNWLHRAAATGYLDTQPFGQTYKHWEDIETDRARIRQAWQDKAEKIAKDNGHTLRPWSNVNSTFCHKCGREVILRNILGRMDGEMRGRALTQPCDEHLWDTSRDPYHAYGIPFSISE